MRQKVIQDSRAAFRNSQPPAQSMMLIELLRAFAQRTAIEHRANLQAAYGQLRLLNTLALQIASAQAGKRKHAASAQRSRQQIRKGKVQ
jgi:hypothetical protein